MLCSRNANIPIALVLTLAIAAIVSAAPAAAKQEIVYNLSAKPMTLDPAYAFDRPSLTLALNMFEGLVRLDAAGRPEPAMAQSWKISNDGLIYRFTLRQAFWSNGLPVTAADFVYAWLRALAPKQPAERTPMLYVLANAEAYSKGAIADPNQVGVTAIDPRTLEVRLARPTGHFLAMCTMPPFLPVCRKAVEAYPDDWSWNPKAAIANGPFHLVKYEKDDIVLAPNPYYWEKDLCRLQSVEFTWLAQDKIESALASGAIDGAADPPRGLAAPQSFQSDLRLTYLEFNKKKPPFDQLLMRSVVAAALDRTGFAERLQGSEVPAYALVPPGLGDAAPGKDFRSQGTSLLTGTDLNLAKQLLSVAGHQNGAGLPPLELIYVSGGRNQIFAETVAANLAAIGMKIVPVALSWLDYQTRLQKGEFSLARMGWIADYPDPYSFLSLFASDASTNYGGYHSDSYDAMLREAAMTAEPAARMEIMHQAEAFVLSDLPVVPVSFGRIYFAEGPLLRNVTHSIAGVPIFARAWVAALPAAMT